MEHQPMGRFDWERIIARSELPLITKTIAVFLAMHANPDGSNVHPGEDRLADITDKTPRYIRDQIAALRDAGLIERVQHGKVSERYDRYQLTTPGAGHAPPRMRLDPEWRRIKARPEPKKRGPRVPKDAATGSGLPVDNPDYRKPASGSDPVDNSATGNPLPVAEGIGSRATGNLLPSYRKLATALPEAGFREPYSLPSIDQLHGSPQVGTSPVEDDHLPGNGDCEVESGPNDTPATNGTEYAIARELLFGLADMQPWMDAAVVEFAAKGVRDPPAQDIACLAAELYQHHQRAA
jgi:hypothetical protein